MEGRLHPSKRKDVRLAILLVAVWLIIVAVVIAVRERPATERKQAGPKVDVPFSPTSLWNTPLPHDAPLDAKSAVYVDNFRQQFKGNYGNVSVNTRQYTPPIYEVGPDVPRVKVGWNDCQKKGYEDKAFLAQVADVPIPPDAKPSTGTDSEMVIWQKSTDTMWDLWKAKNNDGQWTACWGGRLENVSKNNGVFPRPYGTTAAGFPLLAGLIRPAELESGEINHALSIGIVDVKAKQYVAPANRTDGADTSADAIPEGQRFRLDPTVDVNSLNLSEAGKTIARAMQKYGFFVRDHSGSVNFYAENEMTADKPYSSLFNGQSRQDLLKNIPWHRLQAVAPPA